MNSEQLKGNWNELKGELKSRWAELTDDDLLEIEGDRDKLLGKLQKAYGYSREEAQRQIDAIKS